MKSGPIKIQKVDHLSVEKAVDEISYGSAKDKSEGYDQSFFFFRQPPQHHHNENDSQKGEENEKGETKKRVAARKDAKGSPGISNVGQVKQVFDNWDGMIQRYRTIDYNFGCLIQQDNKGEQVADQFTLSVQDETPDLKTLEQRAQTVG